MNHYCCVLDKDNKPFFIDGPSICYASLFNRFEIKLADESRVSGSSPKEAIHNVLNGKTFHGYYYSSSSLSLEEAKEFLNYVKSWIPSKFQGEIFEVSEEDREFWKNRKEFLSAYITFKFVLSYDSFQNTYDFKYTVFLLRLLLENPSTVNEFLKQVKEKPDNVDTWQFFRIICTEYHCNHNYFSIKLVYSKNHVGLNPRVQAYFSGNFYNDFSNLSYYSFNLGTKPSEGDMKELLNANETQRIQFLLKNID